MSWDAYPWRIFREQKRVYNGKPVFGVTMLLTCPYRALFDEPNLLMEVGEKMHRRVQELYRGQGYLPEYEVLVETRHYVIKGKIDLYHPERHEIVEIKYVGNVERAEKNRIYYLQLVSYAALMYKLTGRMPTAQFFIIPEVVERWDTVEDVEAKLHRVRVPLDEHLLNNTYTQLLNRASRLYFDMKKNWFPRWQYEYCQFCPFHLRCSQYLRSAVR